MDYIGRIENDKKIRLTTDEIVIFGAGRDLERILDKLVEMCITNRVVCICDNSREKQGKEINGIKVISPDEAINYYNDAAYIVYNQFRIEICRQLKEQGIEKIHLIRN